MTFSNAEFEALIGDGTKRIGADIAWREDEDHSPSVEFRVEVQSDAGWPLFVRGSYNPLIPALSYVLIMPNVGRVYGLCLGKDHHNPQCNQVGETHKHRWNERFRDKEAYAPTDITASASEPVKVWQQFCVEAKICHAGKMQPPSPQQLPLFGWGSSSA